MKKQKLLIALLTGSVALGSVLFGWDQADVSSQLQANLLAQNTETKVEVYVASTKLLDSYLKDLLAHGEKTYEASKNSTETPSSDDLLANGVRIGLTSEEVNTLKRMAHRYTVYENKADGKNSDKLYQKMRDLLGYNINLTGTSKEAFVKSRGLDKDEEQFLLEITRGTTALTNITNADKQYIKGKIRKYIKVKDATVSDFTEAEKLLEEIYRQLGIDTTGEDTHVDQNRLPIDDIYDKGKAASEDGKITQSIVTKDGTDVLALYAIPGVVKVGNTSTIEALIFRPIPSHGDWEVTSTKFDTKGSKTLSSLTIIENTIPKILSINDSLSTTKAVYKCESVGIATVNFSTTIKELTTNKVSKLEGSIDLTCLEGEKVEQDKKDDSGSTTHEIKFSSGKVLNPSDSFEVLIGLGIINKKGNLEEKINKAEMLKILGVANFTKEEIESCKNTWVNPPSDLSLEYWFYDYICMAEKYQIANSKNLSNSVNKAEMAKIVVEFFEADTTSGSTPNWYGETSEEQSFPAGYDENAWYADSIDKLVNIGALESTPLEPTKEITRGEFLKIFNKMLEELNYNVAGISPEDQAKARAAEPTLADNAGSLGFSQGETKTSAAKDPFSILEAKAHKFAIGLGTNDVDFELFVPGNLSFLNTVVLESAPKGVKVKWRKGKLDGLDYSGDADNNEINNLLVIEFDKEYEEGEIVFRVAGKVDKKDIRIPIVKGLTFEQLYGVAEEKKEEPVKEGEIIVLSPEDRAAIKESDDTTKGTAEGKKDSIIDDLQPYNPYGTTQKKDKYTTRHVVIHGDLILEAKYKDLNGIDEITVEATITRPDKTQKTWGLSSIQFKNLAKGVIDPNLTQKKSDTGKNDIFSKSVTQVYICQKGGTEQVEFSANLDSKKTNEDDYYASYISANIDVFCENLKDEDLSLFDSSIDPTKDDGSIETITKEKEVNLTLQAIPAKAKVGGEIDIKVLIEPRRSKSGVIDGIFDLAKSDLYLVSTDQVLSPDGKVSLATSKTVNGNIQSTMPYGLKYTCNKEGTETISYEGLLREYQNNYGEKAAVRTILASNKLKSSIVVQCGDGKKQDLSDLAKNLGDFFLPHPDKEEDDSSEELENIITTATRITETAEIPIAINALIEKYANEIGAFTGNITDTTTVEQGPKGGIFNTDLILPKDFDYSTLFGAAAVFSGYPDVNYETLEGSTAADIKIHTDLILGLTSKYINDIDMTVDPTIGCLAAKLERCQECEDKNGAYKKTEKACTSITEAEQKAFCEIRNTYSGYSSIDTSNTGLSAGYQYEKETDESSDQSSTGSDINTDIENFIRIEMKPTF
jgi:hypothetical protein